MYIWSHLLHKIMYRILRTISQVKVCHVLIIAEQCLDHSLETENSEIQLKCFFGVQFSFI